MISKSSHKKEEHLIFMNFGVMNFIVKKNFYRKKFHVQML